MKNILSTILLLLATVQLFADDGGVRMTILRVPIL